MESRRGVGSNEIRSSGKGERKIGRNEKCNVRITGRNRMRE